MSKQVTRYTPRSESGQNLIEFAMLTPVVLVFIGAIIVLGFAIFTRASLQQAVREGARQAAVGASEEDVFALAAGNAPEAETADFSWCLPSGSAQVGEPIQVSVTYEFDLAPGGILSAFGMDSLVIPIEPKATARLETSRTGDGIPTTC